LKKLEVTSYSRLRGFNLIYIYMFKKISKRFLSQGLKRYSKLVAEINQLETEIAKLSLEELKRESLALREGIQAGRFDENGVLPKAFALVREASKRTLKQRHYDVQLIGGIVLHEGKIAEMLTGEGKTLAATSAVYLNALSGKGAHVITVNDYLAKRDAVWMGQIYFALGLKVACIIHDQALIYDPTYLPPEKSEELDEERDLMGSFKVIEKFLRPISRREAYEADITYGTNHEFGFDYLRDNLVLRLADRVQREHHYAIIDEVDSILIDEARTPLIISAPDRQSGEYYKLFARIVRELKEGEDYTVDEKHRSVELTDAGIEKAERLANVENIYDPANSRLVHYLDASLKAKALFHRDKDYVVKNGEVVIVDQFTGRMLFGRRYSAGLHQAIEAKEGVLVKEENKTYAQITIQNYFRMYKKLAGMTGTAQTSAEEFHKVYDLEVVSIPPNKPVIRKDLPDMVYKTKAAKLKAVAEEVKRRHELGQPILIGTASISNNEILSDYLKRSGVPHKVLNAKNHEREGEIIAQAGRLGAVTVATNMAGRGVDIILGGNPPDEAEAKKVKDLGGLHVLGTERHEARRIDNQLRGRAGRQGDPGSSQFFLSLEDDLLRIFGGERVQRLMQTLNMPEDMPIESKIVSKVINQAQSKIEGMNFDLRKHLLDFDDVLNRQRTAIYEKRLRFLSAGEKNEILPILKEVLSGFVQQFERNVQEEIIHLRQMRADEEEVKKLKAKLEEVKSKLNRLPEKIEPERSVLIGQHLTRILDALWIEQLEDLESLRESVNIRAYGQHEPIVEYRRESHVLFNKMNQHFANLVFSTVWPIFETDLSKINSAPNQAELEPLEAKKLGRNDPCWCGSGKKYKKCHGK